VWGVAAIAGAAALYKINPATDLKFLRCPFHSLTGLQCPGCGTLRACHSLLHGDFGAALHFNALTIFCLPLLGAMFIEQASLTSWGKRLPRWNVSRRISRFVPWVVLAFSLLRNVPCQPFSLLAP
jgi:hypothetical protein